MLLSIVQETTLNMQYTEVEIVIGKKAKPTTESSYQEQVDFPDKLKQLISTSSKMLNLSSLKSQTLCSIYIYNVYMWKKVMMTMKLQFC